MRCELSVDALAALRLVIKYRGVAEGPQSTVATDPNSLHGSGKVSGSMGEDIWRTLEIPVDVPQRRVSICVFTSSRIALTFSY